VEGGDRVDGVGFEREVDLCRWAFLLGDPEEGLVAAPISGDLVAVGVGACDAKRCERGVVNVRDRPKSATAIVL
jgi:hypothetical protein